MRGAAAAAAAVAVVEAGIFWEVLVPILVANGNGAFGGVFGDIVESLTFWEVLVIMSVDVGEVAFFDYKLKARGLSHEPFLCWLVRCGRNYL